MQPASASRAPFFSATAHRFSFAASFPWTSPASPIVVAALRVIVPAVVAVASAVDVPATVMAVSTGVAIPAAVSLLRM